MKRMMPRARGSGSRILKRSSHIRIILTDEIEIKTRDKRRRPRKKSKKTSARKKSELKNDEKSEMKSETKTEKPEMTTDEVEAEAKE